MHVWIVWVNDQVGTKFVATKFKDIEEAMEVLKDNEWEDVESIVYKHEVLVER